MIKPDAVHRGLIADIIKRFEQKGFKLVAMKFMKVMLDFIKWLWYEFVELHIYRYFAFFKASEELLKKHYEELKEKKFFLGLIKYMSSGPVVAMVSLLFCCPVVYNVFSLSVRVLSVFKLEPD